MELHILDRVLEYENSRNNIDNMLDKIDKIITNSNLILSHLIVDGYELYNNFYSYFSDNIKYIKKIEVVAKTITETSQEVILSTMDYIEKTCPQIEILSDEFYKTPDGDSWGKLINLIEGFNWIIDGFVSIDSNPQLKDIVKSYEQWNLYAQDVYSLKELMGEFEEILRDTDLVSIADILSYEIVPIFEDMKEKLGKIIGERVE